MRCLTARWKSFGRATPKIRRPQSIDSESKPRARWPARTSLCYIPLKRGACYIPLVARCRAAIKDLELEGLSRHTPCNGVCRVCGPRPCYKPLVLTRSLDKRRYAQKNCRSPREFQDCNDRRIHLKYCVPALLRQSEYYAINSRRTACVAAAAISALPCEPHKANGTDDTSTTACRFQNDEFVSFPASPSY